MRQVERCDAQRPEAAEHGEDAEAQVISGRHQQEGVLTLRVTGVVALMGGDKQERVWILVSRVTHYH